MNEKSNIKVAIRARPPMTSNQPWNINSSANSISMIGASNIYTYDRVYHWKASTDEIYNDMAKEIIDGVMTGTNGTIFAYGSTGSGKTYTMTGNDVNPGIIPIAIDHIFNYIKENKDREYTVTFSYFEIYMEKIRDLLVRGAQLDKSFNFNSLYAESSSYLKDKIKQSSQNRSTGSTDMNHYSSRSHAIVRINVKSSPRGSDIGVSLHSTLDLVDLAGSECQKDTNAEGERKLEAASINKSLLALTKVIDSLQKQSLHNNMKQQPLPYRDSKLTMILKDSLGGNAQTMIICNINSDYDQKSTSESSLRFAMNAMCVVNDPKVNKICDKENLEYWKNRVRELEEELSMRQASYNESGLRDYDEETNESIESTKRKSSNCFDDQTDTDYTNDDTPLVLPLKIITRNTENAAKRMISQQTQQNESYSDEDSFDLTNPTEIEFQPSPIQLPKKRKDQKTEIESTSSLDDEVDREAESLSRAILARSTTNNNPSPIPLLEEKIVALTNSNDELKVENEHLIQANHDLSEKIRDLETLLQAQSTFTFPDSNEKDRKIEDLTKANEELKIRITRKEAEAKGAMLTNNVYKKQLEKKDVTIIQLGERIQIKSAECQEMKQKLEEQMKQLEEIQNEVELACNSKPKLVDSSVNTVVTQNSIIDMNKKIILLEREIIDKDKLIKAEQLQNKLHLPLAPRENIVNVLRTNSNQMYENVAPNDAIANLKSRLGHRPMRKAFVFKNHEIAHIEDIDDSDLFDIPDFKPIVLTDSFGVQTDKVVKRDIGTEAMIQDDDLLDEELKEECEEMTEFIMSLSLSESINMMPFNQVEEQSQNVTILNDISEHDALNIVNADKEAQESEEEEYFITTPLPNINARDIEYESPHYLNSFMQTLNMLMQIFMLMFLMTN